MATELHPYHTQVDPIGPTVNKSAESLVYATDNCNSTVPTEFLHLTPYFSIASSFASLCGSFLIIATFVTWKDIRTLARAILVFLAIADFVTAAGYIFGSSVYLYYVHDPSWYDGDAYKWLCAVQSYITTVAPISSFLWTTHLALYLLITIVLKKRELAQKMFIFFHITGWGIPLLACTPALFTGHLGRGTTRTSTSWCFVAFDSHCTSTKEYHERLAELYGFEFLCGKFWEILASIVAVVLYVTVKISLVRQKRQLRLWSTTTTYDSANISRRVTAAVTHLDQKLVWIPVVFILLRLGGTIRFFISFAESCHHYKPKCEAIVIEPNCVKYLYNPTLLFLQSIGDPAQGWGNALLFVFFCPTISKRLCPCCFLLCGKLHAYVERTASWLKGCFLGVSSLTAPRSENLDSTKPLVQSEQTSSFCSSHSGPELETPPIMGPISGDSPPERKRERATW